MRYIIDLSGDLSSNPKLFADDTFLFSVVHNKNTLARELNNDLGKVVTRPINRNELQLLPSQTSSGGNFSCKMTKTNHPTLIFNDNLVHQVVLQKHLEMFLDCKLNLEEHLKTIVSEINKTIGLLCKLQNFLPRKL